MLPLIIEEINVTCNTIDKATFGSVVAVIRFLFLECGKERFGYRIVKGVTRSREGLPDSMFLQQGNECLCGILCSAVTVKD